ncbi:vesicle-associated membrane protein 1-like isoform X1 [Pantherophis guttatus]|uniref:Vesicle-associated membrane protein 1-like isoform X1 n=1 Tax=Pantherophis guttatus TaxID=94885 RepID=A0A6P9DW97_PANGU|nr:vesicle-associated membrane protein 1-like isoform X1 [Pantherophis guttatus]
MSTPIPFQGVSSATSPGVPPQSNMISNRRLQQTQAQVNEVVDIMRVNVDKVLERDHKLSELDNRADALQAGASQFETSAAKLKRKYWWKNCKFISAPEILRSNGVVWLHSSLLIIPQMKLKFNFYVLGLVATKMCEDCLFRVQFSGCFVFVVYVCAVPRKVVCHLKYCQLVSYIDLLLCLKI